MGCCSSGPEKTALNDQSFIDIKLLMPLQTAPDTSATLYYTIDAPKRKASYEGDIIEHTTLSVITAPDIEQSRKQTFNECFSHIEVNTFQNIPIMSVQSHLSLPQIDALQQCQLHQFEDYSHFLDQVLTTIISPLQAMTIHDNNSLTILLDQ